MENSDMAPTIEQAVAAYLDSQTQIIPPAIQAELRRFAHWFGRSRAIEEMTPVGIANYAASVSPRDPEIQTKFDAVKAFLAFIAGKGLIRHNLAVHLKPKKPVGQSKARHTPASSSNRESPTLTLGGYEKMQAELEQLKENRPAVLDEIRRAAADKDFRENAPLHAARERLGYIDGRIKELESILKTAIVASGEATESRRVIIGCEVCLSDVSSGDMIRCRIVGAREYAPGQGNISCVSPIGKAVMGKMVGDVVEVSIPDGKVRYRIDSIKGDR